MEFVLTAVALASFLVLIVAWITVPLPRQVTHKVESAPEGSTAQAFGPTSAAA